MFQGFGIEMRGVANAGPAVAYQGRFLSRPGLRFLLEKAKNPWRGHPFNPENNINDINGDPDERGDGGDVHTLKHLRITRLQENYVKKVIDTLNDLDNVLLEIANESHADSTAWQHHKIDFIHNYEKSKQKQHPVLMTVQSPQGNNAVLFDRAWPRPYRPTKREAIETTLSLPMDAKSSSPRRTTCGGLWVTINGGGKAF